MNCVRLLAGVCLLAAALLIGAAADLVAARQAGMKQLAAAARTIASTFDGRRDFSATDMAHAAAVMAAHSGPALVAQFPPGPAGAGGAALARIDTERAEFTALADELQRLAAVFNDKIQGAENLTPALRMAPGEPMGGSLLGSRKAAPGEPAAQSAEHVFHLMLETCSRCHASYRQAGG